MTKISTELKPLVNKFKSGSYSPPRKKNKEIFDLFLTILKNDDISLVLEVLCLIEKIKGSYIFRRELWKEMKKAIIEYIKSDYSSLKEAAWKTRDLGRIFLFFS